MGEARNNAGILGLNDRKEKDSHPDRKGSCIIDGVEYWVSGWDKVNQYGPFISLAFTRKDAKPSHKTGTVPVRAAPPSSNNFDDDIPF